MDCHVVRKSNLVGSALWRIQGRFIWKSHLITFTFSFPQCQCAFLAKCWHWTNQASDANTILLYSPQLPKPFNILPCCKDVVSSLCPCAAHYCGWIRSIEKEPWLYVTGATWGGQHERCCCIKAGWFLGNHKVWLVKMHTYFTLIKSLPYGDRSVNERRSVNRCASCIMYPPSVKLWPAKARVRVKASLKSNPIYAPAPSHRLLVAITTITHSHFDRAQSG